MFTNFGNDGILAVCIGSYEWRFFVVVFFLNGDHNFTAIYSEDGEVKSGVRTIAMELHKGCITEPHFQDLI